MILSPEILIGVLTSLAVICLIQEYKIVKLKRQVKELKDMYELQDGLYESVNYDLELVGETINKLLESVTILSYKTGIDVPAKLVNTLEKLKAKEKEKHSDEEN